MRRLVPFALFAVLALAAAPADAAPEPAASSSARPVNEEDDENEKHARRILRLDEIERVARAIDDGGLLVQVARIREKETARHAARLTALRQPRPASTTAGAR